MPNVGKLVGGWTNPFEKYGRQIGSFPQIGVKIKNTWWIKVTFLGWLSDPFKG